MLLLDVRAPHAAAYSPLARAGFRRMGKRLYCPACASCRACVPARVVVDRFHWSRRFRRVLRRNADLSVRVVPADRMDPHYALYVRYIEGRHAGGGMDPPSPEHYRSFFSAWAETMFLEVWLGDALVATAITDMLDDGLAAVYTFFDPDMPVRSLGVFSILQQVAECRRRRLPYLYTGYWIEEAEKMRYKTDYRPVQMFIDGRWRSAGASG